MSLQASIWAWGVDALHCNEKIVLLALADYCGENLQCYASYGRLSKKCGMGRSTVHRVLGRLKDKGLIVQVSQGDDGLASTWLLPMVPAEGGSVTAGRGSVTAGLGVVSQRDSNSKRNGQGTNGAAPPVKAARQASPPQAESTHSIPSLPLDSETKVTAPDIPLPFGPRFAEAWGEWQQHRKELKKKLTPTAIKRQLKACDGFTEEECIDAIGRAMMAGWQAFFPRKADGGHSPLPKGKVLTMPSQAQGSSSFARELEELRAAAGGWQ